MSTQPPPARDRDWADRLLADGGVVGPEAYRLAVVLRAAAAPGRPYELAGEPAAAAAYRAARDSPQRRSLRRRVATKLLTFKAAVILAAGAAGGVAVAASMPDRPDAPPAASPPGTSAPAPTATAGSGHSGTTDPAGKTAPPPGTVAPPSPTASAIPGPPASTDPTIEDLCQAYANGGARHGPPHARLAKAAGGSSKIEAYCDELTSSSPAAPGPGNRGGNSGARPSAPPGKPPG